MPVCVLKHFALSHLILHVVLEIGIMTLTGNDTENLERLNNLQPGKLIPK
jgi:hypothetical protein